MKKTLFMTLFILIAVFFLTGCSLIKGAVTDINGWDLSACVGRDEFKVCKELFLDNKDKILGGESALEGMTVKGEGNELP